MAPLVPVRGFVDSPQVYPGWLERVLAHEFGHATGLYPNHDDDADFVGPPYCLMKLVVALIHGLLLNLERAVQEDQTG